MKTAIVKVDGKELSIELTDEQITKLYKGISKKYTLKDLQLYKDACEILGKAEMSCPSAKEQVFTMIKAANFIDNDHKIWDVEEAFDNDNLPKYIGYFIKKKSGWSFSTSDYHFSSSGGQVALYFKESSTCSTICKRIESLYVEYLREGL